MKRDLIMYFIYKIENLKNHKKYIGLTNNVARRRARHFTDLTYKFKLNSDNTIYTILRKKSYKDYIYSYSKLTQEQKK